MPQKTYSFEKLQAWQIAKELYKDVIMITKKYPNSQKFELVSQMCRAALSVVSNIAEGTARKTNKDKAYFCNVAFASNIELLNQLIISFELGFIEEEEYLNTRQKIEKVNYLVANLRKSYLSKPS